MPSKKAAIFYSLFLFFTCIIPAKHDKIIFKLPVHLDKNIYNQRSKINKKDFKLLINNESRTISQISWTERSLNTPTGIGRNFLLLFHIVDYDQSIEDGISYFLSEIIDRNDLLVVASPLRIYQIPISPNKEGISRRIMEIIGRDCKEFRNLKIQAENKILENLKKIQWSLTAGINTFSQFSSSAHHLEHIEKEFNQYKNKFISPDFGQFQTLQEPFSGRDGNSWFIYIQQTKIFSFIPTLNRYLESLKQYFYRPLFEAIIKFKNNSLHSDLCTIEKMKNLIVRNNFCFNMIIQHSGSSNSQITQALKKITESVGGMFFSNGSIQRGFEKVKNFQDQFLELNFSFDGWIENKRVSLFLAGKEEGLIYPKNYDKNDIIRLMKKSNKKRIGIQNVRVDKNRITFTVTSYKINLQTKFAILQIKIEAFDEQNVRIFSTQNTLRASEDTTIISLPFPQLDSHTIRINIEAYDILANNATTIEHNINQ